MEVNEALTIIQEAAHEDANIIFGAVVDPGLNGRVKITVIATGFEHTRSVRAAPANAAAVTPTDLQSYTTHLAGSRGAATPPPAADPVNSAAAHDCATAARSSCPSTAPIERRRRWPDDVGHKEGAEDLEMTSELDVPAFLRRSEG